MLFKNQDISNISLLYYIAAGIAFFAIFQSISMLFSHYRRLRYFAFTAMSIAVTGFLYQSGNIYSAVDITQVSLAFQNQSFWVIVLIPFYIIFICDYSSQQLNRPFIILVLFFTLVFVVVNFYYPAGFKFLEIQESGVFSYSWSDTFTVYRGEISFWNYLFRFFLIVLVVWTLYRARVTYLKKRYKICSLLVAYTVILLLGGTHGFLIELGFMNSLYSAGFVFLVVIIIMNFELSRELHQRGIELFATSVQLTDELERRKKAEEDLKFLAYYDYLTQLPNRSQIHTFLREAIEIGKANNNYGVLLMIDLDHFKNINDTLGHDTGDHLLKSVTYRLQTLVSKDIFLGRFGGDEFIAISKTKYPSQALALQDAKKLAKAILKGVRAPYHVDHRVLNIGASIGCCLFPNELGSELDLLRHVDLALFQAKNRGRNTFQMYDHRMLHIAKRKMEIDRELRVALESEQLSLHYQPQVTSGGEIYGAEALARWEYPKLGHISPIEFIAAAEESGLIHSLGEWVIREGCKALESWIKQGLNFHGSLSINVSPWQFMRSDFASRFIEITSEFAVPPSQLKIEITESAVLYDLDETIEKLGTLRNAGFGIALDDFGTGYSSLAHVRDLPLDLVKIDRAFISELSKSDHNPMVRSMIAMCDCMQLEVISEGVESEAQRDILMEFGCHLFQGYLFSKPLRLKDFEEYINRS